MPRSLESLVSFSAGEWSATLTARVDQEKYRSACKQLRNMIGLKTGPAVRRPGTEFIARAKFPHPFDYAVRLWNFEFSVDTTFILEFGQHYIWFYSNGAQVEVTTAPLWQSLWVYNPGDYVTSTVDGLIYFCVLQWIGGTTDPANEDPRTHWIQQTILEVPTPYDAVVPPSGLLAATEVFQLQFCAINDVVYICHPLHPRYKLTRVTDERWTFAPVADNVPALLDQNATDVTITSSATTGETILTAAAPEWVPGFYYEPGAAVTSNGVIYVCLTAHVSVEFTADYLAGDWQLFTLFQVGHIGSYWELSNLRDSAYVQYTGVAASGFAAGVSATIIVFGAWEVHTYGTWSADIDIQSSSNGGITWQTARAFTGRNDRNLNTKGTSFTAQLYRIVVSNVAGPTTPGQTDPRVVFECVDAFLFGLVQINNFQVDVATGMVSGTTYQIQSLGTINWSDLGVTGDPAVGSIFKYNGNAITGSGGTITTPYRAGARVVTQLPTANAWVSGQSYAAGDHVSYSNVNYVALNAVSSSDAPPDDPTNWSADGYPTTYWSEGAWSDVRGYPRAITSFGQRVWCGGTAYEPQRVWGTQIDDLENWDLGNGELATDGLAFDLDAVGDGAILWLAAQDALFAGLVSAEWVISGSDPTTGITPTSVAAHRQSRWGSNMNVAARVVGDALVFVQRQGFSVRQMLFSIYTSKYMSQDLTALSDQILNDGAVQLAYQTQCQKNGILWATTVDGELVGMTYELDQQIFGWHRHTTGTDQGDMFESVAVIQGQGTDDDEVWVVVKRAVGSTIARYVERLNPNNWSAETAATKKNSAYYVDSGRIFTNPPTNVFTGFDHLVGRQVAVSINAQDYTAGGNLITVAGDGSVTVPGYEWDGVSVPPTIACIGLPFTSLLQPMNLDVDPRTGETQGIDKQVTALYLSLLDTLGCKVWAGSYQTDGTTKKGVIELNFRKGNDLATEPPLFSGYKQVKDFPGLIGLEVPVIIFTDGPLPLTVRGVAIGYALTGTP